MEKKDNTPSDSSSSTDQTPTTYKTLYERRTKKKQEFDLSSPDFSSSDVSFDFDSGASTAGESVPSLSERSLSSDSPKHSPGVEFKKSRLGKQDTLDEVENLPLDTPPEEPATQTVSETTQIDEPKKSTLPLPSSAQQPQHLNVKSCLEEPPTIVSSSGKKQIKIPEKFAMELAKKVFRKVFGKTDRLTKPVPDRETPMDDTVNSENAPGSSSSSNASPTTIMETSTPATPAYVPHVESPSPLTPLTRPELPSESPMDVSEAKDPTDENQANVSVSETEGDRNLEKAELSTSELPSAPSTEGPSDADECMEDE